jgi:hypothetical protein
VVGEESPSSSCRPSNGIFFSRKKKIMFPSISRKGVLLFGRRVQSKELLECYSFRSCQVLCDYLALQQSPWGHLRRCLSSSSSWSGGDCRGGSNNNQKGGSSSRDAFRNTLGLPFSVSPERATQKFQSWARVDQSLNSFLMRDGNVQISAAYVPVYSFDVNIRYIVKDAKTGRMRFDWKPDIFAVYGNQSVIHLPGISAYAGYSFRRSLIDPLHNTTLVFLGDDLVPFDGWMLRDMNVGGTLLHVFPDPWNTTRGRAFAVVKDALQALPGTSQDLDFEEIRVQTEVLASRRVYMPTFVFNYKVLGME